MSGSSGVHEQDCPARYGCCPADEYGWVIHVEPACNCRADHAGAVSVELLPAESVALTVALAQVLRGEEPAPNVAAVCVLALARLTGRHDWRGQDGDRG